MKIKALIDCVGVGYSLTSGESADLPKDLAEKLVRFGYVEAEKATKTKDKKVVNQ